MSWLVHPMFHPASLLLAWIVYAAGLSWLPLPWLTAISAVSLLAALIWANDRSRRLLYRTRWLFLTLAVLNLFATPGEYLPGGGGDIGLTFEGLWQGLEHTGRLLALLTSLALLHQHVGNTGLVAGFYTLMKPLPWREATVVRLMLVLDYVEQETVAGWRDWLSPGPAQAREPQRIHLPHYAFGGRDTLVLGLIPLMIMGFYCVS